MRLFFALLPDAAASKRLTEIAAVLVMGKSRRVPAQNYHVTLAFFGEVENSIVPSIRELGATIEARCSALSFSECEFWPKPGVVVMTGDAVVPEFADFARRLQSAAASHRVRYAPEPPWRPHVTLARNVSQPPVWKAMSPISWTAQSFVLMSSERRYGQSVYTVVDTYPLLDKN